MLLERSIDPRSSSSSTAMVTSSPQPVAPFELRRAVPDLTQAAPLEHWTEEVDSTFGIDPMLSF
jgi:hypothetical protein